MYQSVPPDSAEYRAGCDERREETYRDSVVRGLLLEVHPDGTRTFVAWGRVFTRRAVRMKLGAWRAGVFELADARKAAREALHALATGRDPVVERRRARAAGTFGDLVESFLTDAQIRESTRREWKRLLKAERLSGLRAQRTTPPPAAVGASRSAHCALAHRVAPGPQLLRQHLVDDGDGNLGLGLGKAWTRRRPGRSHHALPSRCAEACPAGRRSHRARG